MVNPRFIVWIFLLGVTVFAAGVASGQTATTGSPQTYPNRPIRVVTAAPGGSPDFVARLIAQGLAASLRQPVIIDNRSSGFIPGEIASKAQPDGYTLLVASNILWIATLIQNAPYDALKDFAPITLTNRQLIVLVVRPSVPAKSVTELIALTKSRPGAFNYSSTGVGGSAHLAAELFKSMAGVDIVRINYKGAAPALNALLGDEVHMMFSTPGPIAPHVKAGRLRALAVTSPEPSASHPDLPTVASVLSGYQSESIYGVFAPPKTPAAIINRLNQEIVRVLNKTEVKEKFSNAGVEVVGTSPEQFASAIKADIVVMGKVIKDAGIRAD